MFGFFSGRRNRIIDSLLEKMVKSKKLEADVPDLYFDAACRYAQDHGGKLYEDMSDSIIFDREIFGHNYSVFFIVGRGGRGVNVTLTKRRPALYIAREEAEEFVRRAGEGGNAQTTRTFETVRERVLESFNAGKPVRFRPASNDDLENFFEVCSTDVHSKIEINASGIVCAGILNVSDAGMLMVLAAVVRGEAIIHVPGRLPTTPGVSAVEILAAKQQEGQDFVEEMFREFRSIIQDEIQERK